jgi:hypothetical protein
MALSKIQEWLQNTRNSFIKFRLNAALRTVHRRHIAFQERILEEMQAEDTQEEYKKLCQLRGIIVQEVEELNELKETKLMAAAAEGRSALELKMLVRAGASVCKTRPDGVTAIWLAAQFGHTSCIKTLAELRADVNQAANDGATPAYIAAQSGFHGCVELLAALGADLKQADNRMTTALHQAAMNGHSRCIEALVRLRVEIDVTNVDDRTPLHEAALKGYGSCITALVKARAQISVKDKQSKTALDLAKEGGHGKIMEVLQEYSLRQTSPVVPVSQPVALGGAKRLIITTGDTSDVDGFLALAEYSKNGADVLFVMNYPAYVGETGVDDTFHDRHPGLGYKYTSEQVSLVLDSCQYSQLPVSLPNILIF